MSTVCTGCNESYPASSKFCPECGTAKVEAKAAPAASAAQGSKCSSCNAHLPASAKFCPECGTKPGVAAAAPAAAASDSGARNIPGLPPATDENCKGCGKPLSGYFLTAMGGKWHDACFKCGGCDNVISEPRFAVKNGKPLCTPCVEKEQKVGGSGAVPAGSLNCAGCGKPINDSFIKVEDKPMHAECFKCAECHKVLSGGYVDVGGKKVCGDCANASRQHRVAPSSAAASGAATVARAQAANIGAARRGSVGAGAGPSAGAGAASGGGRVTCIKCFTAYASSEPHCPECGKVRPGGPKPAAASPVSPAESAPAPAAPKKFCGECGAGSSGAFCPECGSAT